MIEIILGILQVWVEFFIFSWVMKYLRMLDDTDIRIYLLIMYGLYTQISGMDLTILGDITALYFAGLFMYGLTYLPR